MTRRPAIAALDFMDDLDRLVAEPAPLMLRIWPLLGAGLLASLIGSAAILQVDTVVVASGRLATDVPPIVLQPLSGAVLRDLLVQPGDSVRAGQVLARLDPTFSEADRAALLAQKSALLAEIDRLHADLGGYALTATTADQALQERLQREDFALAESQRAELRAVALGLRQALGAEVAAGPGLQQQLAITQEIEAMRVKLAGRQSGSHLAALEASSARIAAEADLRGHDGRVSVLTQQLAAAEARLASFDQGQRSQSAERLARLQPQLAQVQEQLAKADRIASLSALRAPRDGVVLSVASGGPGSLVQPGEAVVVLTPSDAPLIVEIGLRSPDVGQIAIGDPVSVKVDAFPWRKFGMLTGTLADVAHASATPAGTATALHAGRVTLDKAPLENMPPAANLLPGMTVTAEVRTGTRSVLDYFLDPLLRGLKESLREP